MVKNEFLKIAIYENLQQNSLFIEQLQFNLRASRNERW